MAEEAQNDGQEFDELLGEIEEVVNEFPKDFLSPISGNLMIDPVFLCNGQTCERNDIEEQLKSGNWICPVTKEVLADTKLMPNHVLRVTIRDWCKEHGKSDLIQYDFFTPAYIRKEYFESLHTKLSSENLKHQQEAAKDVRIETVKRPYFRNLYVKSPKDVRKLINPLFVLKKRLLVDVDPNLQEDLIATLAIITANETVKEVVVGTINGMFVLIEALESDIMETQRNAASAIYQISTLARSKEIFGCTDAILKLAKLLVGDRRRLLCKDVIRTLDRLFRNRENKAKAVEQLANEKILEKIEDSECIDTIIPIVASLSTFEKGIKEIEKHDCRNLLSSMREVPICKENGIVICYHAILKGDSPWEEHIKNEERRFGTFSDILQNGTPKAKEKAKAILDVLGLKDNLND